MNFLITAVFFWLNYSNYNFINLQLFYMGNGLR